MGQVPVTLDDGDDGEGKVDGIPARFDAETCL